MNWGDSVGRKASVNRRHIRVSTHALKKFHKIYLESLHSNKNTGSFSVDQLTVNEPVSSRSFVDIFQSDDEFLNSEHITEFWY